MFAVWCVAWCWLLSVELVAAWCSLRGACYFVRVCCVLSCVGRRLCCVMCGAVSVLGCRLWLVVGRCCVLLCVVVCCCVLLCVLERCLLLLYSGWTVVVRWLLSVVRLASLFLVRCSLFVVPCVLFIGCCCVLLVADCRLRWPLEVVACCLL